MAIPNINKILEAQAAQRGEGSQEQPEKEDEAMEILKLIFEYIKRTNKDVQRQLGEIIEQQEELKKEIKLLKPGKDNE